MFYTRLLICLSVVFHFQQAVMGQCLSLRGAAPINIEQCHKALATYQFDNRGLLDSDGYKNKKTCGNCAISMSVVTTDLKGKATLDGYTKQSLKKVMNGLITSCTLKNRKGTMLPAILASQTIPADGTFFAMEIEVGDMKPNECSSTPKKQKKT
ncbi:hypothetical protein DFH28DRAFT_1228969 [Melampsora americana]|nr:hypothetical protein DFH28DRAFT_1228969 [Melampsora americana]